MNTTAPNSSRVFEASAATFEEQVITRSRETPVLVDFWATWCGPCKNLSPILDKLTEDYGGALLLAKVDVDQEQELASYFQIRSVPTVMLVKDAQVVGGFPGALPEGQIRQFLEQHGVLPADADDDAATAPAAPADPAAVIEDLRAAVAAEPEKADAKLDLALALVGAGGFAEAGELLETLPAELRMKPQAAQALSRVHFEKIAADAPPRADLEQTVDAHPEDLDARHRLGVRLVLQGEPEAGLEALLELLRRDRNYKEGLPRQALLDAFNVIADDTLVRAYRRRMTALLY